HRMRTRGEGGAMGRFLLTAVVLCFTFFTACSSSDIEEALDIAEGVERRPIDTSRIGVNAFVNDRRFGSIGSQFLEVRDTLGLRYVRVLFAWTDGVQPSPQGSKNFSFYDAIVDALPPGVDALVVLASLHSWLGNPGNWREGNPRTNFVDERVRTDDC